MGALILAALTTVTLLAFTLAGIWIKLSQMRDIQRTHSVLLARLQSLTAQLDAEDAAELNRLLDDLRQREEAADRKTERTRPRRSVWQHRINNSKDL